MPRGAEGRARGEGARLLLHPAPLVALAVLVVNDHLLKIHTPGLMTGKLSDLAGLVYFPLLLFAALGGLTGRVGRGGLVGCVVATGVVFGAVKVEPAATEVYRRGLGALQWPWWALRGWLEGGELPGLLRVEAVTDPTDLVALPMLLVPLWLGLRRTG
ncbi:MAG: hypothetical protein MUF64_09575 [Polyangiaceae bacterium]|nr:hypothetical protein [Polyangiaceae bacterium]